MRFASAGRRAVILLSAGVLAASAAPAAAAPLRARISYLGFTGAVAGARLAPLRASISNFGRLRPLARGAAALFLSSDRRLSAGDVRLARLRLPGNARLGFPTYVGYSDVGRRNLDQRIVARMPAGTPGGDYFLLLCGESGRSAIRAGGRAHCGAAKTRVVYRLRQRFAGTATRREITQCAPYGNAEGSTTERTARAEFQWAAREEYLTAAGRVVIPSFEKPVAGYRYPGRPVDSGTTTTTERTQYSGGQVREPPPSVVEGGIGSISLLRGPGSLTVVPRIGFLPDPNPAERFPYTPARGTVSRRITGTYSTPATGDCTPATTYEWDATVTLTAQ